MLRFLSLRLLPLENAKVRGSGQDFSKLDRTPDGAPVSTSHYSPKSIAVRRRPWLVVRAVAGDGKNNDHRRFPAPCRRASRAACPWRPPPMLPAGEFRRGIVGSSIARGSAFVYQRHGLILSLWPRFAPGPFSFENCCYRRSHRRLVGSLLDECLLDAVTNLGVHRTPRRLCGRLDAAAQLVIKADIEPRWLLPIVRMHGHPIQCRGGTWDIRPNHIARWIRKAQKGSERFRINYEPSRARERKSFARLRNVASETLSTFSRIRMLSSHRSTSACRCQPSTFISSGIPRSATSCLNAPSIADQSAFGGAPRRPAGCVGRAPRVSADGP